MPPSCHDLPFLRSFLCERGGERRSWGILASQFQACEGVSSCAALTPHLSPSLLHRDGFADTLLDLLILCSLVFSFVPAHCPLPASPLVWPWAWRFFDRLTTTAPRSLRFRGLGVFLSY